MEKVKHILHEIFFRLFQGCFLLILLGFSDGILALFLNDCSTAKALLRVAIWAIPAGLFFIIMAVISERKGQE